MEEKQSNMSDKLKKPKKPKTATTSTDLVFENTGFELPFMYQKEAIEAAQRGILRTDAQSYADLIRFFSLRALRRQLNEVIRKLPKSITDLRLFEDACREPLVENLHPYEAFDHLQSITIWGDTGRYLVPECAVYFLGRPIPFVSIDAPVLRMKDEIFGAIRRSLTLQYLSLDCTNLDMAGFHLAIGQCRSLMLLLLRFAKLRREHIPYFVEAVRVNESIKVATFRQCNIDVDFQTWTLQTKAVKGRMVALECQFLTNGSYVEQPADVLKKESKSKRK